MVNFQYSIYEFIQKEKYFKQLIKEVEANNPEMLSLNQEMRVKCDKKYKQLVEKIKANELAKDEKKRLKRRMDILEGGEDIEFCICELKPHIKKLIQKIALTNNDHLKNFSNYEFYSNVLLDYLNEKDSSFNNFLKLTITSSQNVNDKVKRIHKNLKERNTKFLEYVGDVLQLNCY